MSQANWPACFGVTLRHEGGYVDHPRDPGGATNLGITRRTLSGWLGRRASKDEVRALTPEAVRPIYRRNYWDRVAGDDLPSGVDLVTYDAAVNSGPPRGAKWTQLAAGAKADGVIGPLSLAAIRATAADTVIRRATDRRLDFLQALSTWRIFGRGWGRRVGEVRAAALAMASVAAPAIQRDADELTCRAGRDERAAGGAGAGGIASGGGAAAVEQTGALDWTVLAALGLAALLLLSLAILIAARSRAVRAAAAAMRDHLSGKETAP